MINFIDQYKPVDLENEIDYSRLIKLGKDFFEVNSRSEFDYITYVKDCTKLSSLEIPEEYKEIFIPKSNPSVYWIYDSWLMLQIEDYMKTNFLRAKNVEIYKAIKENFIKWATTKLKNEKEYYANNVINLVERDVYKQNFFKYIINGIIYLAKPGVFNLSKVLNLFETAKEIANSSRLADNIKNELSYIITLYIGFAHLRDNAIDLANITFRNALEIKKCGVTAKLYSALAEVKLGNHSIAESYLNEILDYDFNRLILSMKLNNFGMFNFFIKTGFFQNVFYELDFWPASETIEKVIHLKGATNKNSLDLLFQKCTELKKKNIQSYLNTDITNSITMLEKISINYKDSRNIFITGLANEFENKFHEIIQNIIGKLKETLDSDINEKLSHYKRILEENQSAENHTLNEIEKFKVKSKDNLAKTLESIEDNYNVQIKLVEEKIENIPFMEKYNPQRSFSVNMSNNFIVAFIVMLIGAFAGSSGSGGEDHSGLNAFFSGLVTSGIKWGLISFFVGTLISLIISAMVLIEKADEKQKLLRKINLLKKQKSDAINEAKIYSEHREKVTLENYNNNLAQYRKNIKDLTEQINYERDKLNKEASEKIKAFEDLLAPLLS